MRRIFGDIALRLRTFAGLASMIPIAAGGITIGVITLSKRNGVNFFTDNWPKVVLTLAGVELNVIGAENLAVCRPAVFIFNHRNNFDVFVTATLVGNNWTAVGKKELERDPIASMIGKIVDAAFIDRGDPLTAIGGLQKVEQLARNGLSIIIAPEGTRTDTNTVGPFKKGPFRIAMSAKIPIVPVVIRNADEVADRHSTVLHPGTIDVAVLPPISVAEWALADLDEHIAGVHQLYVEALTSWPTAGSGAVAASVPDNS
ncbi:lysophospholipid acyltransferase family protein [Mycolicibacterium sp. jd]|uniref:lysophospholipid acyltransferase family protein n=1 Tax=unclassified Mycolicibacterium TaxID=2636767 RepID=UPI00351B4B7F